MNAKIRTLSAILLCACLLASGMPFAAAAENEPATPTDLAPLEEVIGEENGTGENEENQGEESPAAETPAGEPAKTEDPAGGEPFGDGRDDDDRADEEPEEETGVRMPELPFGPAGTRGTLKAGEAFEIALRPETSRNILVTLTLVPKAGSIPDAAGVRMTLNGEKKNPVRIENEDPESREITLQFAAYTAKGSEYILSITSPADADFILTAVKRPETAPEEPGSDGGKEGAEKEAGSEEKTEVESAPESGEKPANEGENEGAAGLETDPEPEAEAGEPEEPSDGAGNVPGEDSEPEKAAETEGTPGDAAENETAAEAEPAAEPVKDEPATPTDLAPAGENQDRKADDSAKADSKKETGEKKEDKETLPAAEELLALGYYGCQVAMTTGTDVFESMEEGAEPAEHLEPGTELWLRPAGDEAWAETWRADEKDRTRYIRWDDVIITLKPEPEGEEEEEGQLPARYVEVTSTLWDMLSIPFGTEITMTGELVNFLEDDTCTFQWQYRTEGTDTFTDIEGANERTYTYRINRENYYYIWRLTVLVEREE